MKKLIAVLGILISIGALYLAVRDIDLAEAWAAFGQIQPGIFVLGLIPWVITIASKVFRWRLLYYPDQDQATYPRLTSALMIGYLFNTVLPLRTGEIVRATVMQVTSGLPVARSLSTILVEKVLDTMALIAMLGLILPFVDLPAGLASGARVAAIVFGAIFLVVLAAALRPDSARLVVGWMLRLAPARFRPALLRISNQVLDGLVPLRRRELAPGLVFWTIVSWASNALATYLFMGSFGLWLPFTAPVLMVDATNLGMTVPSAPGYVGVYEAIGKEVLQVYGVAPDVAFAFSTFLHVVGFVPLAVYGLICMVREGLTWGAVQGRTSAQSSVVSRQSSVGSGQSGAGSGQPSAGSDLATKQLQQDQEPEPILAAPKSKIENPQSE